MKILRLALLLLPLLLPASWIGCSENRRLRAGDTIGEPVGSYDKDAGPLEKQAIDPVTGERVFKDTPWKTLYGNRWYFFSSEANEQTFNANPSVYVDNDGRLKQDLEIR